MRRAAAATLIISGSLFFAHSVLAQTCTIPGTRAAVASDPAVQTGVIPVGTCFNPSAPGVSADANAAKQYLYSIAQGLPGTQAPPTQDRVNKLNDTFAVCAANFFKAYTQASGVRLTLRSAVRCGPNSPAQWVCDRTENARAGGASASNHQLGLAIDVNPADGNYQRLWDYASKNPQFGVCFPYLGGDRPHIVLAGSSSGEGRRCASQGVTQPCNGLQVAAPSISTSSPQSPFPPFTPSQPAFAPSSQPTSQPTSVPTPTSQGTTPIPSIAPSTGASPTTGSYGGVTGSYGTLTTGSYTQPYIPFYTLPTSTTASSTSSTNTFQQLLNLSQPTGGSTNTQVATSTPTSISQSSNTSGVDLYGADSAVFSDDGEFHKYMQDMYQTGGAMYDIATITPAQPSAQSDRVAVTETFSGATRTDTKTAGLQQTAPAKENTSVVSTLLTALRDFLVLVRDTLLAARPR